MLTVVFSLLVAKYKNLRRLPRGLIIILYAHVVAFDLFYSYVIGYLLKAK